MITPHHFSDESWGNDLSVVFDSVKSDDHRSSVERAPLHFSEEQYVGRLQIGNTGGMGGRGGQGATRVRLLFTSTIA